MTLCELSKKMYQYEKTFNTKQLKLTKEEVSSGTKWIYHYHSSLRKIA